MTLGNREAIVLPSDTENLPAGVQASPASNPVQSMTSEQSERTPREIRLGACLAITVGAVGIYKAIESLVSPALPIIQNELGATRAETAWVITGVLLTGPIVTPLVGRLADIYDKRKIILAVMLIVTFGTFISSISYTMPTLIVGQLLQGCGLSLVPLATGILKQTQSDGVLKFGNSLMVSSIYGATAVGMLVAGPIADNFHYTLLFWLPCALMLILTIFAWRLLPSCPPIAGHSRRVDFVGGMLFATALSVFLIALTFAPGWGWSSSNFLALCGVSVAALVAFVAWELRHKDPLVDLRLVRDPRVSSALIMMIVSGYTINSFFVSVPIQVHQPIATGYGLGATATITSLILVPGVLVGACAPVINIIERRLGRLIGMIFGPMIMAIGFFIAMQSAGSLPLVAASMFCAGFGSGVTITQAMNLVVEAVPSDRVGAFSGVNFVTKAIGSTSGAQVVAGILSTETAEQGAQLQWSSFMTVFAIGLVACTIAVICAASANSLARRRYKLASPKP